MIGLTTYDRDENEKYTLPAQYIDSIRRAGGMPFPIMPGEKHTADVLSLLDGLILVGGGDIDPKLWGGKADENNYMISAERDQMELELTKAVIDSDLPTLGICRGAQMINTAFGGNLFNHLPDEFGESIDHRLPPREPVLHELNILEGTLLHKLLGRSKIEAASWHHQAIRDLGKGLVVNANADDGVVEGLEFPSHRWLLAVQWHPELTSENDPLQQKLFDELIKEIRHS